MVSLLLWSSWKGKTSILKNYYLTYDGLIDLYLNVCFNHLNEYIIFGKEISWMTTHLVLFVYYEVFSRFFFLPVIPLLFFFLILRNTSRTLSCFHDMWVVESSVLNYDCEFLVYISIFYTFKETSITTSYSKKRKFR